MPAPEKKKAKPAAKAAAASAQLEVILGGGGSAAAAGAGAGLKEYIAKNNDTPAMIAAQFGVRVADIVRLNRPLLPGLTQKSKLKTDTRVLLPPASAAAEPAQGPAAAIAAGQAAAASRITTGGGGNIPLDSGLTEHGKMSSLGASPSVHEDFAWLGTDLSQSNKVRPNSKCIRAAHPSLNRRNARLIGAAHTGVPIGCVTTRLRIAAACSFTGGR